jgi:hypothetical protein
MPLALQLNQLVPLVSEATEQTRRVFDRPITGPEKLTGWRLMLSTLAAERSLAELARKQGVILTALAANNFVIMPKTEIRNLAEKIDSLIADERSLFRLLHEPAWWCPSVARLSRQVEHLDSIAESLHWECDDEASALLGMAVEQFAAK